MAINAAGQPMSTRGVPGASTNAAAETLTDGQACEYSVAGMSRGETYDGGELGSTRYERA